MSDLTKQMQNFVAESCVGASALRNQGKRGLLEAARGYFKEIKLKEIPKEDSEFNKWLNKHTAEIQEKFCGIKPKQRNKLKGNEMPYFGSARKALNLFLRSCAYNVHLNKAYKLNSVLHLLEVPLDSYGAEHLLHYNSKIAEKWVGLKNIKAKEHLEYQTAASLLAESEKINRVDLDVFFYRIDTPKNDYEQEIPA